MPLTVGFDLDMTLIDARPGMVVAMNVLAEQTGLPLDGEYFAANLGPPLAMIFRGFGVAEELIPDLVARYRASYPELVIPTTVAMPGAAEAMAAVRELGGRVLVVTGKHGGNARLHLEALGWQVDHLAGELWSAAKGVVLAEQHASVYVGDHVGDVEGALAAGAVPVAVSTGPCDAAELLAAGAEVVLPDLTAFPAWLADNAHRFAEPMAG
ncbi:HAD family hydrolase [Kutzneria viridogrisea]|uniref:Haloacid dehalogenase domain protein hydrolase n=2 Tax=Kutzneria TaxID=43356 RepID=W5VZE0_9PSEU|nr:HAD hydrolase-like protein [Kutzneria albida]AHH93952.1 Haloacid dehalogenase domain protein hydrolase [Kutzneria albida DSM 43870]MBA8931043.1 phosphoglycolate phosphatase [Kutzneria viridogrisea]